MQSVDRQCGASVPHSHLLRVTEDRTRLPPRGRVSAQNAPRSGINHLVRKGLAPKKKPSLGTLHQISDNSSRPAPPDPEYCDPFVGGAAFTRGAAQPTARRPLPRTRDGFRNIFPLRGFPTYILVPFVDQRLLARTVVTSRQGEDDVDARKTAGFSRGRRLVERRATGTMRAGGGRAVSGSRADPHGLQW